MPDASANFRGIRLLLVATTCLALNDACNKYLVATMSASQIVFMRGLISGAIVLAVLAMRSELPDLRDLRRPDILLRGFAEAWIGPLIIIAFAFMYQADATAVFMVAPVFVALVGFTVFKEPFSWTILLASLLALAGAILFVNPGSGVFQWVALLPLLASACQVLREIISRTIGKKAGDGVVVSNRVVLMSTAIFSLITAAIVAILFPWATPVSVWRMPDATEWFFLVLASALFYIGVTFTFDAYRGSDLSVVAPFRYWYLMVAILAGYFAFGEIPGLNSALGMIVIVGAGGLVLWHQHRRTHA